MYKFCALQQYSRNGFNRGNGRKNYVFCPGTGCSDPVSSRNRTDLFQPADGTEPGCHDPSPLGTQPSDYLDAMGATGVRGLRVANECNIPVTINDRDPQGIALITHNANHANLPVEIVQRDASALLSERSFDAVDLDPFGTPAMYIDAAVRGTRRFLFITATDTAPLCGAHLKAGKRRYFAQPMNTEYHGEVGLRILLGFVVRETVKYDRGVEPLFCFAHEHFVRLHLRLLRGANAADDTMKRIGYILQCKTCQYRTEQQGMFPEIVCCPHCKEKLTPIGPLWLGSIQHEETLVQMQEHAGRRCNSVQKKILLRLIDLCRMNCRHRVFMIITGSQKLWVAHHPVSVR